MTRFTYAFSISLLIYQFYSIMTTLDTKSKCLNSADLFSLKSFHQHFNFKIWYIFFKKGTESCSKWLLLYKIGILQCKQFLRKCKPAIEWGRGERGKPISAHLLPLHLKKVQCREDSNKMHFWNTVVCILVREKNNWF